MAKNATELSMNNSYKTVYTYLDSGMRPGFHNNSRPIPVTEDYSIKSSDDGVGGHDSAAAGIV